MTLRRPGQGLPRRETFAHVVSVVLLGIATPVIPACSRAPEPVAHATDSPQTLAQAVLDALAARDPVRLRELALTESEFARLVWPQLPASRPQRNLPLDYVWNDLKQKSDAALTGTLARVDGRGFRLVRIEFTGGVTQYETFVVHRGSRLVVTGDPDGEQQVRFFGSVYEDRARRFKVFSYVVD